MGKNEFNAEYRLGEYIIRYKDENIRVIELGDNEKSGIVFLRYRRYGDGKCGSFMLDSSGGLIIEELYCVQYRIKGYEIEVIFAEE